MLVGPVDLLFILFPAIQSKAGWKQVAMKVDL